jgi:hypothetical protein
MSSHVKVSVNWSRYSILTLWNLKHETLICRRSRPIWELVVQWGYLATVPARMTFSLRAITASVAEFSSRSGTAAKYPHRIYKQMYAYF